VHQQVSDEINAQTRCCAVYGHPVKHSASPAMHNAAFRELKLNWVYLAFDVLPERLQEAIEGAAAMKFIGLNLTVPHKIIAFNIVDFVDPSALPWGAVNTIRFEAIDSHGNWRPLAEFKDDIPDEIRSHGFNTDAEAIELALREDFNLELKGASVLLLGTGGAGRVAALKMASCGVRELYVVNRTQQKAEEVINYIKNNYPDVCVKNGFPDKKIDLILNATSAGLQPDAPLPLGIDESIIRKAGFVYDMIYRPAETTLLKVAKKAGCKTANGLSMLLWQGVRALEIWTGLKAPVETMRSALIKNIYGS
jgi:shikimate dehydrogenase